VLGGALLAGQDLPIDADPTAAATAGRGFVERAAATLTDTDLGSAALGLVREAFVMARGCADDLRMALGGFCLGVLYAAPYLPERGADPAPLIAAACQLARDVT
jgi:hypothetical protein